MMKYVHVVARKPPFHSCYNTIDDNKEGGCRAGADLFVLLK